MAHNMAAFSLFIVPIVLEKVLSPLLSPPVIYIHTSHTSTMIPACSFKMLPSICSIMESQPEYHNLESHTATVLYCHMLVTRHGVSIDNWIYWTLITRNYK
jgi:hypothetical protein